MTNRRSQVHPFTKGVKMDTIKIEINEIEPPKFKCATCDNNITESRARMFPICDDCPKVLREIIKAHKEADK